MPTTADPGAFALAVAGLFVVAILRGQATYWLARLVVQGTAHVNEHSASWRRRFAGWVTGPRVGAGRALLGRWGLPLVTLCYLTVGLQTIVLAAAGALRIGWPRFTLAQLPGALAWALIYSTVGFAAWEALIGAALSSPLVLAGIAALGTVVLVTVLIGRRRSGDRVGADSSGQHRN